MATRGKLRRLKKMLRGNLESIPQRDGSVVYVDLDDAFAATFTYFTDSLRADANRDPRPEPPPALVAVANAVDRRAAYERVMDGANHLPVELEALLERGEFVPRCMVSGYASYEAYMASGVSSTR